MSVEADEIVACALNRIADALFQQSKALKRSADATSKAVELSAEMVEMQKASQAVTKQLEHALSVQAMAAAEEALGGAVGRPV